MFNIQRVGGAASPGRIQGSAAKKTSAPLRFSSVFACGITQQPVFIKFDGWPQRGPKRNPLKLGVGLIKVADPGFFYIFLFFSPLHR